MGLSSQWDALEVQRVAGDGLYLPYDRITNELSEKPRFVRGQNTYVTYGGKLAKRLGTLNLSAAAADTTRKDRLWLYETLDTPPRVYILSSTYNSSTARWFMEYINLDAASPVWTSFGSLRNVDASQYPHEVVVSRGIAYVKGFPDSSGDKLGTVLFDGTAGADIVKFWGILGPTTPARMSGRVTLLSGAINSSTTSLTVSANFSPAVTPPFTVLIDFEQMTVTSTGAGTNWTVTRAVNGTTADSHADKSTVFYRDWSASTHRVTVNLGWQYTYAYKTSTNQISNRAAIETNPDFLPSSSGPFTDLIPKFTVQGHSDTTRVPSIVVYRSMDGGGTFYELMTVANTGSGSITVQDNQLGSGGSSSTFNDPIPDSLLSTGAIAPSLTSNSPPPSVIAPSVVGTDPVVRSTPIVTFQARLWYGVGNVLFFSGQEEVANGIPEESWPSGLRGNFFRFPQPIMNLVATDDVLYVMTLQNTYVVTGRNLETFTAFDLFDNLGAPYGHPRAVTRFGNRVAFLTHDFRVVIVQNNQYQTISDPLFTDLIDNLNAGGVNAEVELRYFGDLEKEFLFVNIHRVDDTALSRQWVYDLKLSERLGKDFWHTPWTVRSTAMLSGRVTNSQSQRRAVFAVWDQDSLHSRLVRLDTTGRTGSDLAPDGTLAGITLDAVTNLFRVPPGDHANEINLPGLTPTVYAIIFDRMMFTGVSFAPDEDPQVYWYKDDLWTDPITARQSEDPARRSLSKGYKTQYHGIDDAAQRVAVEIRKINTFDLFEMFNLAILFAPTTGA